MSQKHSLHSGEGGIVDARLSRGELHMDVGSTGLVHVHVVAH